MSAPRWGVSVRDWHAHAVDGDGAEHHHAVWVARCGTELRVATLYDEPPTRICFACANPAEGTP
ncbi:MAG: hypothetical protein ACRDRU_25065 [Pseudonocardiaceae bacterium]